MSTSDSTTLQLACDLINRPSVTPDDLGCQQLLAERLEALDFTCEHLRFGVVDNLWARRGDEGPLFVFAGHTDVVPSGPENQWRFDPFKATVSDGMLYGRGAADMKGSVAAFITATERFLSQHPQPRGAIGLLITSDEEGPAVDGTRKVIDTLQSRNEHIDWCLVGEPSSTNTLGDVIKIGRRGSLNGTLTVMGIQGHIAYPHLADNPIHNALPALAELASMQWDQGNQYFPATSLQLSNINAGTGATNVIPGDLEARLNFRFSTEVTADELQARVEAVLKRHDLNYVIEWSLSGNPFFTQPAELSDAASRALQEVCGITPDLSTSGGTSDGRFIAPTGAQVIELGPLNATIHQIDEHVSCASLEQLSSVYETILKKLLT
ncbi:MAG TPA: succinyl-diaminopimelate desuccinylase [Gammaproteobacteria bacterium]|jgi:succinyl-diaminopimelate desuccinylase|nr:succinyl-diaminopimelate desuccinylase [Gammaproteobacteria bacterium]